MKPSSLLRSCLIGLAFPMLSLAQPTITVQPQSQTNVVGSALTLSVEATGVLPLVYRWRKTGVPMAGATNSALVFTNVQPSQAGNYTVVITNVEGAATSTVATLTVLLPPRIMPSTLLQNKAAYLGTLASFTVTATGTAPLGFQWRLDGHELPGQTNRLLALNTVQPADEGDYTVMVTNVAGAAVSEAARLYVVPASTNFILRNFTNAAGMRLPYFFFLPSNYDPTRSYPVVCYLHGSVGDETTREITLAPYPQTLVFGSYKQQATDPAILVSPTRRAGDVEWTDQYLQQVSGLLDWLPSEFSIDTNRVYIAGFSAGVHATWDLLGLRPGSFAASRIVSGWQGITPAASVKEVPLWAIHAANDDVVGVASSRSLIRALRQAGGNPIYTEFSSGGHIDGGLHAVCTPAVNDWLLAQRRGMGSTVGPLLSITSPTQGATHLTSATNLNLAGSAEAPGPNVTSVSWENLANNVQGTGAGTNEWNAMDIPLQDNRTNLVLVTATTTSWAPAFGGITTFNDTLVVVSSQLRVSIDQVHTGVRLRFTGVPGRSYNIERAPSVAGPWSTINTQIAPASGLLEYLDTTPHPGSGFYRTVQP